MANDNKFGWADAACMVCGALVCVAGAYILTSVAAPTTVLGCLFGPKIALTTAAQIGSWAGIVAGGAIAADGVVSAVRNEKSLLPRMFSNIMKPVFGS